MTETTSSNRRVDSALHLKNWSHAKKATAMGMSKLIQLKKSRTLEERYEMLRKTLDHYLLLQVGTFVTSAGYDAIGPAMNIFTDMDARLKIRQTQGKCE